MATSERKQAVLANVGTQVSGNAYTHESVEVTKTATMTNGSLLLATNLEAAVADAATVTGIIDYPQIDLAETGDVVLVSVAKRSVIANTDVINFSDAVYDGESLTALEAKGVVLQSAEAEFEYKA